MLSGFEAAKYSSKKNGIITAYGANTNQGIVRFDTILLIDFIGTIMRTAWP